MLNSVGLQGPGVAAWLEHDLPPLLATGARVVASIWGRSVGGLPSRRPSSSPTPRPGWSPSRSTCRARTPRRAATCSPTRRAATAEVMAATAGCGRPRWAKLSPNVTDLVPIAAAARDAGAEAVTLVNTVLAWPSTPTPARTASAPGRAAAGCPAPAIHPVAVRAVHDVHAALPDLPIVGVGGVSQRRGRRRAARWPAPARSRSAPPPSPTRAPPARVLRRAGRAGPRRTGRSPLADSVGAAHEKELAR